MNCSSSKKVTDVGHIFWVNKYSQFHREDGPAVIWKDGTKIWYQNNLQHRVGKPSYISGDKKYIEWKQFNQYHRLDGPAIIKLGGDSISVEWWIHGLAYHDDIPTFASDAGWSDKQLASYLMFGDELHAKIEDDWDE